MLKPVFELPSVPSPVGDYVLQSAHNGVIEVSGQVATDEDGIPYTGQVGSPILSVEEAQELAANAVRNSLSVVHKSLGSLDNLTALKLRVFVAASDRFVDHHKVANGASRELRNYLGDRGVCSRTAIGVSSLPRGAAVEIELTIGVGVTAEKTNF